MCTQTYIIIDSRSEDCVNIPPRFLPPPPGWTRPTRSFWGRTVSCRRSTRAWRACWTPPAWSRRAWRRSSPSSASSTSSWTSPPPNSTTSVRYSAVARLGHQGELQLHYTASIIEWIVWTESSNPKPCWSIGCRVVLVGGMKFFLLEIK